MGGKGSGFASMSKERQRKIASAGGKAAHAKGKAHKWTHATAKVAGRLGGLAFRVRTRERKLEQQVEREAA